MSKAIGELKSGNSRLKMLGDGRLYVASIDPFGCYTSTTTTKDQTRQLYEAMKQHFEPSPWVSVDERLPFENEQVLWAAPSDSFYIVNEASLFDGSFETYENYPIDGVTHWMPIPQVK